jgi:1-acyl-sn-glycerol-3-phosphate acyltransferase
VHRTIGGWIHSAYGWPNYLFWTAMAGLFIAIGALNRRDHTRWFGIGALHWCWGRLMWWTTPFWWKDVRGLEHLGAGPYVIVANHQSTIDIPCLYGLPLPMKISARTGIFHVPVMGRFLAWSGQIDTGAFFEQGREALASGVSVVVFPEGSRSADGQLQRFHAGAFRLAHETGTAILPVAMDGAQWIMAKQDWFARRLWVTVKVRILPPLPADADPKELSRRTRDAIGAALAELRSTP